MRNLEIARFVFAAVTLVAWCGALVVCVGMRKSLGRKKQ